MSEKKGKNILKRKIPKEKLRDALLVSVLAFLLVFAVWKIFYTPQSAKTNSDTAFSAGTESTEKERSLAALLSEIDGVGEAEVRICEAEDQAKSVVVVCDGAKNILVNMNIREAVAAALGIDEKNVKIYLKSR